MGFTWYEKVHREEKLDPKRKKFEALRCLIEHLPQQNDNNSSYAHIVSDQHLTLEYVIRKLEDEGEEYFSKGKRLTRLSYAASFHCLLDKLIAKLDGIECDDEVTQQRIANERAAAESVKTYLLEKVLSAAEDTNLTLLNSKDLEKKIDHQNKLKSRTRAWMKAMAAARAIGCGESVSAAVACRTFDRPWPPFDRPWPTSERSIGSCRPFDRLWLVRCRAFDRPWPVECSIGPGPHLNVR
jgi:hypothetical protein